MITMLQNCVRASSRGHGMACRSEIRSFRCRGLRPHGPPLELLGKLATARRTCVARYLVLVATYYAENPDFCGFPPPTIPPIVTGKDSEKKQSGWPAPGFEPATSLPNDSSSNTLAHWSNRLDSHEYLVTNSVWGIKVVGALKNRLTLKVVHKKSIGATGVL